MEKKPREQWSGRLGFVLATAGSAVGLGNIMKFPWMTGQYGGAAFLFTYIVVMLVHFVVLASPLGEESIEDVLGHEVIEADAMLLLVFSS